MTLRLPSELSRAELESPGAAFARQARMESQIGVVFDRILRTFLADSLAAAQRDGLALSPALIYAAWADAIDAQFERSSIPSQVLGYARLSLDMSDLPQVVYDSVRVLLNAAATEAWPDDVRDEQLRLALRPSQAEVTVALVAAGFPRNGAQWDRLDQGGMKFMDRMKRDARTAVTGLDGILTTAALAEKGFTRKRWVTMHDAKVRETHVAAEGQTVALEEPFYVGGYPMMHPGDRNAPIGETVQCRCVVVGTRWRAARTY